MLTELDQKVLDLHVLRMELNDLIEAFNKEKKVLEDQLKEKWGADRFARYQKNVCIANRAELDESFENYQRLDNLYHDVGIKGIKAKEWLMYKRLENRFSRYQAAIEAADVLLVKEDYASDIAASDECAEEMMEGVKKYQACRTEIVVMVKKTMQLTEQDVRELENVLDLYAIIDYKKFPTSESMPRLLFSERLEEVRKMKSYSVFAGFRFMNLLKADCVHIVHKCFLMQAQLKFSAFTLQIIQVYQHQDTDITQVLSIFSLEGAASLIENAETNLVLTENLAAICAGWVDAHEIESKIGKGFVEVLVTSPSVNEHNVGKIYGFSVDKNGGKMSSKASIAAIANSFARIRQDSGKMQLRYVSGEARFSYIGSKLGALKWFEDEDTNLNNVLFDFEV